MLNTSPDLDRFRKTSTFRLSVTVTPEVQPRKPVISYTDDLDWGRPCTALSVLLPLIPTVALRQVLKDGYISLYEYGRNLYFQVSKAFSPWSCTILSISLQLTDIYRVVPACISSFRVWFGGELNPNLEAGKERVL